MSESKTYSFRAECALDVSSLQAECEKAEVTAMVSVEPDSKV